MGVLGMCCPTLLEVSGNAFGIHYHDYYHRDCVWCKKVAKLNTSDIVNFFPPEKVYASLHCFYSQSDSLIKISNVQLNNDHSQEIIVSCHSSSPCVTPCCFRTLNSVCRQRQQLQNSFVFIQAISLHSCRTSWLVAVSDKYLTQFPL